jgi:copper chaperone CopZ
MMKTLLLHVTEVSFDFDEEDFTVEEQQSVIDSVVGNTFEVEVDDTDTDEEIAQALVEEVTDRTGWCVYSLDYRHVLK